MTFLLTHVDVKSGAHHNDVTRNFDVSAVPNLRLDLILNVRKLSSVKKKSLCPIAPSFIRDYLPWLEGRFGLADHMMRCFCK